MTVTPAINLEALPEKIKDARKQAGLSRRVLGKKIGGSSISSVQAWETGESLPRIDALVKVAEVTGYPLQWFLSEAPSEEDVERALTIAKENQLTQAEKELPVLPTDPRTAITGFLVKSEGWLSWEDSDLWLLWRCLRNFMTHRGLGVDSVEESIQNDPHLDEAGKQAMLAVYRATRKQTPVVGNGGGDGPTDFEGPCPYEPGDWVEHKDWSYGEVIIVGGVGACPVGKLQVDFRNEKKMGQGIFDELDCKPARLKKGSKAVSATPGEVLARARKKAGYKSRKAFAQGSGFKESSITKFEQGKMKLTLDGVDAVVEALGPRYEHFLRSILEPAASPEGESVGGATAGAGRKAKGPARDPQTRPGWDEKRRGSGDGAGSQRGKTDS